MPGDKHTLSTDSDNDLFSGAGGFLPMVPNDRQSLKSRRRQPLEVSQARPGVLARINVSREHRLVFEQHMRIARAMGMSSNQAVLSANRAAASLTGIDSLGLLGITHAAAPQNEVLLTPTDIGKKLGGMSARAVNAILCRIGLQTSGRDHKGHIYYEPTEAGVEAGGVMQDTGRKRSTGVPIRQLRWASGVAAHIREGMSTDTA